MILIARPIDLWPGTLTPDRDRVRSRFDAAWTDTVDLLSREASHLGAREIVVQLAITDADLRLDGFVRASAQPTHPGVIVSFDSKHGPLRYATDTFTTTTHRQSAWQHNVRAVALGLEALRKVDRYGIAEDGEQYRGWNALPPPSTEQVPMTVDQAIAALHDFDPSPWDHDDPAAVARAFRAAAKRCHPDAGGDSATFRLLTEARDLLLGATS